MSLTRADFARFFAETHDTTETPKPHPYMWQEALLDTVLSEGRWPDRLVAPTGAGKTAVIDVHIFAQALTAKWAADQRPPRRLSLVVARRVLVDDQYAYARKLAETLAAPKSEVMCDVAERLWSLHPNAPDLSSAVDDADELLRPVSPLVVARLRGGQPAARQWRDHPTAPAILCATPDMWGSRLLFRGYGASRKAWPREAGLLAFDSVVVVDEAHLSQQFLRTARRVSQLASISTQPSRIRTLQVVETTATPSDSTQTPTGGQVAELGVSEEDLCDDGLRSRLERPKPVKLIETQSLTRKAPSDQRKVAAQIADTLVEQLEQVAEPPGARSNHTVGCFVNTVARALAVSQALRERQVSGRKLCVVTVCGQVRPFDLDRLHNEYPGLLTPTGNPDVDVVVSTQSLEVGVDIDFAAVVTELASASAVAQRAGRVNRRGLRQSGPLFVLVPDHPIDDKDRLGPYKAAELCSCLEWLKLCAITDAGLAPWQLQSSDFRPPAPAVRRVWLQRPELAQAWHWARTSDDLAAEPQLDLWLSEDLEDSTEVSIVVRRKIPQDASAAIELTTDLPPQPYEHFPVRISDARTALSAWDSNREKQTGQVATAREESTHGGPAILVRGEEVTLLPWDEQGAGSARNPQIRPGDIIVLDDREKLFTTSHANADGGFSPSIVAPKTDEELHSVDDALLLLSDMEPDQGRSFHGHVLLRIEPGTLDTFDSHFGSLSKALSNLAVDEMTGGEKLDVAGHQRRIVRDWLLNCGLVEKSAMAAAAAELLNASGHDAELVIHEQPEVSDNDDEAVSRVARVLVLDRRRPVDEELRQVWTKSLQPVMLADHQYAVGQRARLIGTCLGLPEKLIEAVAVAGYHHDDGKADDRFQRRLGRRGKETLAKSDPRLSAERARSGTTGSGLPARWRHEQASVVHAWSALRDTDPGVFPVSWTRLCCVS